MSVQYDIYSYDLYVYYLYYCNDVYIFCPYYMYTCDSTFVYTMVQYKASWYAGMIDNIICNGISMIIM